MANIIGIDIEIGLHLSETKNHSDSHTSAKDEAYDKRTQFTLTPTKTSTNIYIKYPFEFDKIDDK